MRQSARNHADPGSLAPVRVLIAAESLETRVQLAMVTLCEGAEIVAKVANGTDAAEAAKLHSPDLLVLDLTELGPAGLECLSQVQDLDPAPVVVVLAADSDAAGSDRYQQLGASAVLDRQTEFCELCGILEDMVDARESATVEGTARNPGWESWRSQSGPTPRRGTTGRG